MPPMLVVITLVDDDGEEKLVTMRPGKDGNYHPIVISPDTSLDFVGVITQSIADKENKTVLVRKYIPTDILLTTEPSNKIVHRELSTNGTVDTD